LVGYLACTIAYESSIEQSVAAIGEPENRREISDATRKRLAALEDEQDTTTLDFQRFSFDSALAHPFVLQSDDILDSYLTEIGYTDTQRREFLAEVHKRFVVNLKSLMSHGKTRERFAPLTERMALGTGEAAAYEALREHAEYQRWLFEEKPVFGTEPFALADVYVDTECGQLSWREIRDGGQRGESPGDNVDPFSDKWGGRHLLSEAVLRLMRDPDFKDAIVIQGVAGAGKSAFTLWLCAELVRQGLRPIRVLLRDLRLEQTRPISEVLAQAIRYPEEAYLSERPPYPHPDDPFLDGNIFKEKVRFGNAYICPYVLILDGWDEINISVSEGFKVRIDRMLEQLRNTFLNNNIPLRVVLTGRPSTAIMDGYFLRQTTPILEAIPKFVI
jgi:hypothetical protein